MEDQQYFLQTANRCFAIGRACMDLAELAPEICTGR
jgi:hypothetical protein